MKTKHTPGPWIIEKLNFHPVVKIPSSGKVYDGDGMMVCVMGAQDKDHHGHANAKLIAAAPDLLEALKASQQIIMDLISSKRIVNLDESIAYNNSLIKRATE